MLLTKTPKKILALLAMTSLFVSYGVASALTISPARAEKTGDPGEVVSDSFLVINEQDTDQTFYTSVENFDSQGETGTPNFTAGKEGLPTWITVLDKVVLKKGERRSIPYTINIPKDADAGGHFAAIFLSTVPPTLGNGQVSVGAKVGMLVLLTVTGATKEGGGLLSFALKDGGKVKESLPIDFMYRFNNTGNNRVQPEGEIIIKNTFGMEVAKMDANKSTGNVLPNSIRRYDVHYGESVAPTVAAPFLEHVKYQMSNFALGMYTANLSLKFGNSSVANSSLTYFMFPWQLITVIAVVLLVVIILLLTIVKRYNRWIIKQARQAAK